MHMPARDVALPPLAHTAGQTPLVYLKHVDKDTGAVISAKLEAFQPLSRWAHACQCSCAAGRRRLSLRPS